MIFTFDKTYNFIMDTKEHVNKIIDKTFEQLLICYENQEKCCSVNNPFQAKNSRLIFPKYGDHRGNESRISEQEMRFVFVEEFNKYCSQNQLDWFYSVETPTMDKYIFSEDNTGKAVPRVADTNDINNKKGQSASFDLVIHGSEGKRIALIEFKALNPSIKNYKKDFVKLNNPNEYVPNGSERFFVLLLDSYDKATKKNIVQKLSNKGDTHFRCCSLGGGCIDGKKIGAGDITKLFDKKGIDDKPKIQD